MASPDITLCDRCQYGEEEIILPFFSAPGLVVDVGAADGATYSNSRFLIRDHGWRGVMIEPEPRQFAQLADLYRDSVNARVIQAAAASVEGVAQLWPAEMGSTMVAEWRDRIERTIPGLRYGKPVPVRTAPLTVLLDEVRCPAIDFLSVDAEGMDLDILRSMDWSRWRPKLVCVECGQDRGGELFDFMAGVGYVYHAHTTGNTFWRLNGTA